MNYYPFHIGDFRSGSINMSRLSRWIYRDMLDLYYDSEKQLPLDLEVLCDAIGVELDEEIRLVERLLRFKFVKTDVGYQNSTCDRVIAEYHAKADIAKANGKLGGRPRKAKPNPKEPSGFPSGSNQVATANQVACGSEANQEPLTNNQSILVDSVDGSLDDLVDEIEHRVPQTNAERDLGLHISLVAPPKTPATPPCPHDALIDLFGDHLPGLAQPRKSLWMGGKNAPALKARWDWVLTACHESGARKGTRLATTTEEGLNWFSRFFAHIAKSDFLSGRSSEWACDLIWIVNKSNFEKIIQGTYDNKEKTA